MAIVPQRQSRNVSKHGGLENFARAAKKIKNSVLLVPVRGLTRHVHLQMLKCL